MSRAFKVVCTTAVISNKRGLHARAAAKFVKLAETFSAEIIVAKDSMRVSGRSIMGLMMLAAAIGSSITISGTGVDAPKALNALEGLVRRKFDETE
ncbi:MAG: HPr family phosphocarrier protein [Alphaproteobacteria bacterium]|nr:HPr family phosphocarrier protein [Alphaproteobacteria bacterium]